jgi:hypothetical protein
VAGFRWGATKDRAVSRNGWVLVFALLAIPTGHGATPSVDGPGEFRVAELPPDFPPPLANLTVSPPVGWVAVGNSTSLNATWIPIEPGCTIASGWFQWFLPAGSTGGILADPNGSAVNFTGTSSTLTPTEVGVRSAATLHCGGGPVGIFRTAYANVTSIAPLELQNLTLSPGPLVPPGHATLGGRLVGGVPPYRVQVLWGDGNLSNFTVPRPGSFEVARALEEGLFRPEIDVLDRSGREVSAFVSEPVEVTPGTGFAVEASAGVAEVGTSVRFATLVDRPTPLSVFQFSACGTLEVFGAPSEVNLTCTPAVPGTLSVVLSELVGGSGETSSLELREPVAPALAVSLVPLESTGEVGQVCNFEVRISGGVPPFHLAESVDGDPFLAPVPVAADGPLILGITPTEVGFSTFSIRVADADGFVALPAPGAVFVESPLDVNLQVESHPLSPGAPTQFLATLAGGEGPVDWAILSDPNPNASSAATGTAPTNSSFDWSATFDSEGLGWVDLVAVDAGGSAQSSEVMVPLIAPPVGSISVAGFDSPAGPVFNLTLEIAGGAPPYSVWINTSEDGNWNATDPSDGNFTIAIPFEHNGPSTVHVAAMDTLGGRVTAETDVLGFGVEAIPAADPPSGAVESLLLVGFVALLGVGGLVLYLRARIRDRRPPAPPANPEQVLEGILAPADGAERVTVELLAEEAGVPLELVRSTLDRLIGTGQVRSEVAPDGMEVLAWSAPSPT